MQEKWKVWCVKHFTIITAANTRVSVEAEEVLLTEEQTLIFKTCGNIIAAFNSSDWKNFSSPAKNHSQYWDNHRVNRRFVHPAPRAALRLIVAGGRDYIFGRAEETALDALNANRSIQELVSSNSSGASVCAEKWARSRGILVVRFPVDVYVQDKQRRRARLQQMMDYANALALFRGGEGTARIHQAALCENLEVFDYQNLAPTRAFFWHSKARY